MQTCEHHRAALYDSSSLDSACDEEQDTHELFLNNKKIWWFCEFYSDPTLPVWGTGDQNNW